MKIEHTIVGSHSQSQNDKRVVVLGGLGFIGSHITRALVRQGYDVRVFGKADSSRALIWDISNQIEITEGDITQADQVLRAIADADVLIHLVHTTRPASSMIDPFHDVCSNVASQTNWLKRLSVTNLKKIIYVSSGGTIYGIPQSPLVNENHPTDPICSYGITKLAIEKYISMYSRTYGINYCMIRPGNIYGNGSRINSGQGIIGVLSSKALRGEQLEIWGTGENLRDYLHVDDLVSAVLKLMNYEGAHKVFNVSSGTGHSILDIVDRIGRHFGKPMSIVWKPSREFDVPVNVLDSSRLCIETGWQPRINLDSGIARTIKWLKESQEMPTENGDR